ncbi:MULTISPECIES: hypothetical protein [unclassified Nocardia]|uniref:hypothetical protein n=1 Tax=unclassified Nocardia TaxID=2637762 RepID=UPI001CE4A4A2|nr:MULTISPECIES: hypothetical protein [unclassified Nocardia]
MTETRYNVEIQPSNGFGEFKNETFIVGVEAETFDSAARRGIRKAISRAIDHNGEQPAGAPKRPEFVEGYRVVGVRIDSPMVPKPAQASAKATGTDSNKVVLTLEISGGNIIVSGEKA